MNVAFTLSLDAALTKGHHEERPIVRHHAEHDASWLGDLPWTRSRLCILRDERNQALLTQVEHPQLKPCLQEVERHGLAHLTQTDESDDLLHTFFLSWRCIRLHAQLTSRLGVDDNPAPGFGDEDMVGERIDRHAVGLLHRGDILDPGARCSIDD